DYYCFSYTTRSTGLF
nr:immunoglobulin light chain junction region [Macaca mulatta]MOX79728.1 immunoglobulin light chain junction region [Macaca mulatta]